MILPIAILAILIVLVIIALIDTSDRLKQEQERGRKLRGEE